MKMSNQLPDLSDNQILQEIHRRGPGTTAYLASCVKSANSVTFTTAQFLARLKRMEKAGLVRRANNWIYVSQIMWETNSTK